MAELGFVGLGTMGSRMAKRLLDAGHLVTGHNRTKAKAAWLLDAGMAWGETSARGRGSLRCRLQHGERTRARSGDHVG